MLRWECIHFRGVLAAAFGGVLTSLRPSHLAALKRLCSLNYASHLKLSWRVRNSPLPSAMLIGAYVEPTMAQPIKSSKGQCLLIGVGYSPTLCSSPLANLKLTHILSLYLFRYNFIVSFNATCSPTR